ncbi:uncharacterized protein LOC143288425 [Babylonia areolata]|uniref:uncharacterized protein LOC143288425 n=1 Tax=Babylonia areolata TaxID=304850 RepID=UPI003FD3B937
MATDGMTDYSMSCAICLGPYQDPKFLSCFHTFCLQCISDVASRHPTAIFPCPTCRTPISLPAGGVASLKTNFYITSTSTQTSVSGPVPGDEFCKIHGRGKALEFYCTKCDQALCLNCKLTEHERHPTEDLPVVIARKKKKQLKRERRRLESAVGDMLKQIEYIEQEQAAGLSKKAALENAVKDRHATAIAAANKWRDEALASLESVDANIGASINPVLKQKKEGAEELKKLQEKIDQALKAGTDSDILAVAREVSTGCGNKQRVSKMASAVQLSIIRPVLYYDVTTDDVVQKLKGYMGTVSKVHFEGLPSKAEEVLAGRSGAGDDAEIYSLCPDGDDKIFVSYARVGLDEAAPSEQFNLQGQLVSTLPDAPGKLSLKYRSKGNVMYSTVKTPGFHKTYNKSQTQRHFRLNNDLSGRAFVIRVTVISEDPFKIKESQELKIQVGPHHAFDADYNDQLFIVVEEGKSPDFQRQVGLYRKPLEDPIFTYTPPTLPFRPTDVAFHKMPHSDSQVLLIADEANDSIHVVSVQGQQLHFVRHLAAGSPLLIQPTALNTDSEGRVWVGCRGGKVILIHPSTASLSVDDFVN